MDRNIAKQVSRELAAAGRPDLALAYSRSVTAAGGGFRIGPGGLEETKSGITLQPNTLYFMGASSSPDLIYVTDVSDDRVDYISYPFYETSGKLKSPKGEQRWVAEDLIIQGSETWLKNEGSTDPKLAKSLKNMLAGKKGTKEKIDTYEPWTVLTVSTTGKDEWRTAEEYGGVAGLDWEGEQAYEINTTKGEIPAIEKDKALKIVGKYKGWGRKGPAAYSSARGKVMARKITKAAGGQSVPLPKEHAKEAEKMKAKGYKFIAQLLQEDGKPFGEPLYFKTADQMARFIRTEKMKIDWYSSIARTQVTAASNPEVVRELIQMGILPATENPSDYPAIGQDPTWRSLYAFPSVTAKKKAIAQCLRAGKKQLATVISKMQVESANYFKFVESLEEPISKWFETALHNISSRKVSGGLVSVSSVKAGSGVTYGAGGVDFVLKGMYGVAVEGGTGYTIDDHTIHVIADIEVRGSGGSRGGHGSARDAHKIKPSTFTADDYAEMVFATVQKAAKDAKINL